MKDAHFTVLGFTAAEQGTPVMCAITFAAKELELSWVQGLNPFVEWHGNEDDFNLNTGKGKRYPQGPVCVSNGKHVPTFCCCSELGSITAAELLLRMLAQIDALELFDCSDGINTLLIVDGHSSQFECSFLEYINSPLTPQSVCIGVPYGTSYWQVRDSLEQNGSFKMELTVAKRDLVLTKKTEHDLPFAIEKSDIVTLVSTA